MAADKIKGFYIGGIAKKIDYNQLDNLPSIPSSISDLSDGSNVMTSTNAKIEGQTITLGDASITVPSQLSDTDGGYGQRIKAVEDALAAAINFDAQIY